MLTTGSRFVKHPEYLKEGQRLVFREGRTKAVGNVNKVLPYTPAVIGKEKAKTAAKVSQQQVRGEGKRRQTDKTSTGAEASLQAPTPATSQAPQQASSLQQPTLA